MKLISDWRKILIPAPLVLAALGGGWVAVQWAAANLVFAADFEMYQISVERRILTQQQRQLESEVLRLKVKKEAYPRKFDAVDKALLEEQSKQLEEVKQEVKQVEERSLKRRP